MGGLHNLERHTLSLDQQEYMEQLQEGHSQSRTHIVRL